MAERSVSGVLKAKISEPVARCVCGFSFKVSFLTLRTSYMREPTNRSDSFKGKRLATEPLLSQCDITDIICPNPGANAGLNLRVRFMVQQHGGSFRCTSMSSFRARCGLCCQGSPIRSGFAWRRRNHHRGGTIVIAAVQKPSAASRSAAIRFSNSLRYGCRTISRSAMRTGMIESCCRPRPLGLKLEDRCLVSDLGLAPCCSARFRGYSPHD